MTTSGPVAACSACGRTLRAPASVEARLGRVCRAKRDRERAAALLAEAAALEAS